MTHCIEIAKGQWITACTVTNFSLNAKGILQFWQIGDSDDEPSICKGWTLEGFRQAIEGRRSNELDLEVGYRNDTTSVWEAKP